MSDAEIDLSEDVEPVLRSSPAFFEEEEVQKLPTCGDGFPQPLPSEHEKTVSPKSDDKGKLGKDLMDMVNAEEYLLNQTDCLLLDYERQMFLDMVHADALLVAAKGISIDRVLLNILKVYSDAANLILVINGSEWQEDYLKTKLDPKYLHEVANTATERERVYLNGGIQFISTRVLVVDLLKQRIPTELITGIVVLRAHTIIESCQEAFCLRLYRQNNKTGFIKAFSSSPEAFTIGYGHIERTMRNLFVKELFIWPRFHATIQASLKPYEAQATELNVPMSARMTRIQTHILDIMNYLVREVKRINRMVDLDEVTVENCVTEKFHKILQAQLDCIWHRLNSQTKLIIADLKILRNLMISTMYNDAVSAYALIKRYRTTEYAKSNSGWTFLDAAEEIFTIAKERVYNAAEEFEPEFCPKWKYLTELLSVEIPGDMKRLHDADHMEAPKVLILCQDARTCYQLKHYLTQGGEQYLFHMALRQEIPIGKLSKRFERIGSHVGELLLSQTTSKSTQSSTTSSKAANKGGMSKSRGKDTTTLTDSESLTSEMDELQQMLTAEDSMIEDYGIMEPYQESYMLTMTQTQFLDPPPREEGDEESVIATSLEESQTQNSQTQDKSIFEPFPELENLDITAAVAAHKQPLICVQTFKTEQEGPMALQRILDEIKPQYVIMYHCNVMAIRQLEVYEARLRRPLEDRLKVFFLMHGRTVEEQSYLTSLRREKQAFELIIETKRTMVVPEYQDGKSDDLFTRYTTYKDPELLNEVNERSRKAGGQQQQQSCPLGVEKKRTVPKIIVDMREFRSDLPCLIHKRGLEVVPVTISIGDYILTPEICVERKSISDLIGSLNSGRLYNQCIQMQRFYAKPILLIEFDQNKPFHLQGKYMLSQQHGHGAGTVNSNVNNSQTDVVRKLQLLTLHFPRLRLIWSPSPYATAQLFEELKTDKEEPDAKQAAAIGDDDEWDELNHDKPSQQQHHKLNANLYDFLVKLPGLNTRNVHKLMKAGGCLKDILQKSEAELSQVLESSENGKLLWNILHNTHRPLKDAGTSGGSSAGAGLLHKSSLAARFRRGALLSAVANASATRSSRPQRNTRQPRKN